MEAELQKLKNLIQSISNGVHYRDSYSPEELGRDVVEALEQVYLLLASNLLPKENR